MFLKLAIAAALVWWFFLRDRPALRPAIVGPTDNRINDWIAEINARAAGAASRGMID